MIFDPVLKNAIQVLSPSGAGAKLSILIFHRILPTPDPILPGEVDAAFFDELLGWLKSWFNVLPLDQAANALQAGTLPARAAAITFDDGYADNHDIALPLLKKHGLPATFFIATGFLNGGTMWNDTIIESIRSCPSSCLDLSPLELGIHPIEKSEQQQEAIQSIIGKIKYLPIGERIELTEHIAKLAGVQLPTDLMMSSRQVQNMRREGMQIGAHTVSHPILATTDRETAISEIQRSKQFLEELLNEPISLFAYPNGKPGQDYLPEHIEIIKNLGFSAAVSTHWASASATSDPYQLPRFTPWNRSQMKFWLQIARNLLS